MDGAKAGSLNDWEKVTWPEENRKSKTRRESNTPPPLSLQPRRPPPHPVLDRTWPRGQGGFDAALRAVSVGGGVNTPRVNVCLLMMLDVISVRFTSNYVSKQSGESFKSSNVVIAKSSKSQSGRDFWQNSSHGIQIQIGNQSYQITKVIYKVTHSHSLSALNIFGKGIDATLDFMQEHMFYFVFHLVMTMHMVF